MDALVTVISLGTRTELWLEYRCGPFALKHKRKNGSGMRHNRMLSKHWFGHGCGYRTLLKDILAVYQMPQQSPYLHMKVRCKGYLRPCLETKPSSHQTKTISENLGLPLERSLQCFALRQGSKILDLDLQGVYPWKRGFRRRLKPFFKGNLKVWTLKTPLNEGG